jgi:hypothetical protein
MTSAKRKVSISLDADLVAELGDSDEALSKQVNDAVRDALERRRRHRMLKELCAALARKHGAVPRALVAKYESLLS